MTPPAPVRRRSALGRALRRAAVGWVFVLGLWLAGQWYFLSASPTALASSVAVYLLGGLILVALLYTVHHEQTRGVVERLRRDIERRLETTDLSPLAHTGTHDLDPLIDQINQLFKAAQQRYTVTSAITTAVRTQAEGSTRDQLTGLHNRAYLKTHLPDEVGRTKALSDEMSLIMLDVDHFKHYNDTNGHPMGDQVLRAVGDILTRTTRALDVCIRYGGEEFTVVLPRTSHERARLTAERIRQAILDHPFPRGENQPGGRLTISLGLASLPRHAGTADELLRRADEALYAAKQTGRNRVVSAADLPARA